MRVEVVAGDEVDKNIAGTSVDAPVLEVVRQEKEDENSGVPEDYQNCTSKEVCTKIVRDMHSRLNTKIT